MAGWVDTFSTYQPTLERARDPSLFTGRWKTRQLQLYSQLMLTISVGPNSVELEVMNRLGRAMADPTRSRILLSLLRQPGYPAQLAAELQLTRSNVSNHLACLLGCRIVAATAEGRRTRYEISDPHLALALGSLLEAVVAVDENAGCSDASCPLPGCCA